MEGNSKTPSRVNQKKLFLSGELLEGLVLRDALELVAGYLLLVTISERTKWLLHGKSSL